jgi:hypothetical protein
VGERDVFMIQHSSESCLLKRIREKKTRYDYRTGHPTKKPDLQKQMTGHFRIDRLIFMCKHQVI